MIEIYIVNVSVVDVFVIFTVITVNVICVVALCYTIIITIVGVTVFIVYLVVFIILSTFSSSIPTCSLFFVGAIVLLIYSFFIIVVADVILFCQSSFSQYILLFLESGGTFYTFLNPWLVVQRHCRQCLKAVFLSMRSLKSDYRYCKSLSRGQASILNRLNANFEWIYWRLACRSFIVV